MSWLCISRESRNFIKSFLIFLLITSIPATVHYFHWRNDIVHQNDLITTSSVIIEEKGIYSIMLEDLPFSSDVIIEINETSQENNTIIFFYVLKESHYQALLDGTLPSVINNSFVVILPEGEFGEASVTTEISGNHYITLYVNRDPEITMNLLVSYQVVVEGYYIRNSWMLVTLYAFTWIATFSSIRMLKKWRRTRKRLSKLREKREREEEDFLKRFYGSNDEAS